MTERNPIVVLTPRHAYVRVQKATLVFLRGEYDAAISRGKAFSRREQEAAREALAHAKHEAALLPPME
jgi:hypothetical protein